MAKKPARFCVKDYEPDTIRAGTYGQENPRQACGLTFSGAMRKAKEIAAAGRVGYVAHGGPEYRSQRPLLSCKRMMEGVVCTSSAGIRNMARSYRELYAVEGDPAAGHRRRAYEGKKP